MSTPARSWRAVALPFVLLTAGACSSSDSALFSEGPGSASFAIAGADVTALQYVLRDRAGAVVKSESLSPAPGGGIQFSLDLPANERYAITLAAQTADGRSCTGSSEFDVTPRARVEVDVELECSSGASVTGTLVSCPNVSIASAATTLDVGASLVLATSAEGTLAAAPTWTASAGTLETLDGITRFTCTAAGDAEVRLSAGGDECGASDSVLVHCTEPAAASACDALGSTCHVVGDASVEAHACHELGHGGDAAACFAQGRECFELCTRAHYEPVSIQFAAQVGAAPFACGSSYDGVGSAQASVEPLDFRFFVHDVRLIAADASEVPLALDERAPWQGLGAALLDFEDATGACLSGDAAINTFVTGHAPPGDYTGIAFRIGVPESANHGDPAVQPAPLAAGSMTWGWLSGYKFLRAELGSAGGGAVLHLGAAGCSGDPAAGGVSCSRSNRPEVAFAEFDAASDVIVADLAALFAGSDLSSSSLCHSSGATCAPAFERLGLNLETGQSLPGQSVFRVAP
jgi:uncharacterized repeat protein (TIGR04052 family)